MTSFALLFTLSAIGISETAYLIKKRIKSENPFCVIGDNCSKVLASRYSKIFLMNNDVLGLIFYIVISFLSAFLVIEVEPLDLWNFLFKFLVMIASLFSVFLTYVQSKIIRVMCFWCLMSACTIWLMGVIILLSGTI